MNPPHSRLLHSLFILQLSSFILSLAAPPPELTVLRTQYEKVLAERVTAPFDAALTDLNTKFTAALDNAADEAKKSGSLPAVLAIEADKKRIAEKLPLPDADDEQTPDSLKKLRAIYREQLAKLSEQRAVNHGTLLVPYTTKLQSLETTLTKADRVEEAKEVMSYREGLAVGLAASMPPPKDTPSVPASVAASGAKLQQPEGDDRKAAEWVLGFAVEGSSTRVAVRAGSVEKICKSVQELPKGKFAISGIYIDGFSKPLPKPIANEDTKILAGLAELKTVHFNRAQITDEGMRFVVSCPMLTRFDLHAMDFGDEVFAHMAGLKKLVEVVFNSGCSRMTGTGLHHLKDAPLVTLELLNTGVGDAGIPYLMPFRQLRRLNLGGTKVTDASIGALASLKSLASLSVVSTDVTPVGLLKLKGLALTNLSFGATKTWNDLVMQLPAIASAFPDVIETSLPRGGTFGAASIEPLTAAFPKLLRLQAVEAKFEPGAAQAIAKFSKLEELNVWRSTANDDDVAAWERIKSLRFIDMNGTQITDASLELLARHKSLNKLYVAETKVTDAGFAAFKKARPDVKM